MLQHGVGLDWGATVAGWVRSLTRRPFETDGKDLGPFYFNFPATCKAHNSSKTKRKLSTDHGDPFVGAFNARENTQWIVCLQYIAITSHYLLYGN
jgi:hypothetical protein